MQFGVFDHMDSSGEPLAVLFENRLKLAEAYDRLGIHALHVAEHHSTPLGMSPSPSVFLALAAQRTRRLGVGRGVSPLEIASFGVDPAKSQAMYLEAYQVVMQALGSRSVSFRGEYYTFDDVPFIFEPVQKPHPPLWYGVFNAESTEWAARTRVNVVTNLPAAAVRAITDSYRAHWAKLGRDPRGIPFMGMNRHIVVAETDRDAMEIGRRAYRRWFANFSSLWRARKVPLPKNIAYSEEFDGIVASGQAIAGSPQTVREAIERQAAESGVNYVLARLAFGDLSLEESLESAELFARGVMPGLAA